MVKSDGLQNEYACPKSTLCQESTQGVLPQRITSDNSETSIEDLPDNFPYKDIIDLPHHVSKKHPCMSRGNRAAQFAPFAALSGLDGLMEHTKESRESEFDQ